MAGVPVLIGILADTGGPDRAPFMGGSDEGNFGRSAAGCERGTAVSGTFYVRGIHVGFRTGPGTDRSPVVNRKASESLGRTWYRTLEVSMVLEGLCETDLWLKARIVKLGGNEGDRESGWVRKKFITGEASGDMKSGLLWDIDGESSFTDVEKAVARRAALKILKAEPNCAGITTGYRSGSRKQGTYYVTCDAGNGDPAFNLPFTSHDVASPEGAECDAQCRPELPWCRSVTAGRVPFRLLQTVRQCSPFPAPPAPGREALLQYCRFRFPGRRRQKLR